MKAKKRAFSLVEVIVSLMLIAIAAAVLITPNKNALSRKQFLASMSQLAHSTCLAKQLAFNYDTTVALHFDMEKDVLICRFECDDRLKESFRPLLKEMRIRGVSALYQSNESAEHLTLHYVSKAGLQEDGFIKIGTKFFNKPIVLGVD